MMGLLQASHTQTAQKPNRGSDLRPTLEGWKCCWDPKKWLTVDLALPRLPVSGRLLFLVVLRSSVQLVEDETLVGRSTQFQRALLIDEPLSLVKCCSALGK